MIQCPECGKVLAPDTIHTCSPQVAAQAETAGWLTMSEAHVEAAQRNASDPSVPLNACRDIENLVTELCVQRAARLAAERERDEARHALEAAWHREGTTPIKLMEAKDKVSTLQRQNRVLREIAENILGVIELMEDCTNPSPCSLCAAQTRYLNKLRARLADIDKGEG